LKSLDDQDGVVLKQELALDSYLQSLLTPRLDVGVEQEPQIIEDLISSQVTPVVAKQTPVNVSIQQSEDVFEKNEEVIDTPPVIDNGIPDWAQSKFENLLFKAAGLTMAVPLIKLNGVLVWDPDVVTRIPNSQSWFLGIMNHQKKKVKLINVSAFIVPEGKSQSNPQDLGHILLVGDGEWGLVCDSIVKVLALEAVEVKWRSARGRRPWLAGTVIQQMCALLDVDAFIGDLQGAER